MIILNWKQNLINFFYFITISVQNSITSTDLVNTDSDFKSPKEIALEWLLLHGILDVNDVLGVLCESDIGLRTAEDFSR